MYIIRSLLPSCLFECVGGAADSLSSRGLGNGLLEASETALDRLGVVATCDFGATREAEPEAIVW